MNRRKALQMFTMFLASIAMGGKSASRESFGTPPHQQIQKRKLGVSADGFSDIYVASEGTVEQNTKTLLQMMGGIQSVVEPDDVVIIKPNSQWWNQGMTNTNAVKEVIRQIINIPRFRGEIVIADNHQFQEDESRGWITDTPNGDYNLNQLVKFFQNNGFKNVTKYHWHCGGPNKGLVQGDAYGHKLVTGPEQGDGYVWRQDLVYQASSGRKTMMSYPVFTSHHSGITLDFKRGAYKNGEFLKRKIKLINMPSLNHHSPWGGVTCCIKNYLGIVDMTCGYHGDGPKGFFNLHYVGHSDLNERYPTIEKIKKKLGFGYIDHFHGGPVGFFMRTVRMADINIITADWVGYGSRTDPKLSSRTRTMLGSTDPVALDYFASKYILLPATPKAAKYPWGEPYYLANDPDNKTGPLWLYLSECNKEGIGNLDESRMRIHKM